MSAAEPAGTRAPGAGGTSGDEPATARVGSQWSRIWRDVLAGLQTLVSAAVYATLIVTFGFQVARVDGLSMAPTLEDHDRLIVNKLGVRDRRAAAGRHRDALLPAQPREDVRQAGDRAGRRYGADRGRPRLRQRRAAARRLRARRVPQPRRLGPPGHSAGLLLRHGRPPEQQLRQPPLGLGAEEIHRRQGEGPMVAAFRTPGFSDPASRCAPSRWIFRQISRALSPVPFSLLPPI